jgi:hypothetical protein
MVALAETKGLSTLWLVAILATFVVVAGRDRVREVVRYRLARFWMGASVLSGAFGLWWVVAHDSLALVPGGISVPRSWSLGRVALAALGNTPLQLKEMVGVVGWLDTPAPSLTFYLWGGMVALIVALGAISARRRDTLAVAGAIVAMIVVPVLLRTPDAQKIGIVGQGKDTLPLAVGVPILAAWAAGGKWMLDERMVNRLLRLIAGAAVLAQLGMFLEALRRYEVGAGGPLAFFSGRWRPPVELPLLVVLSLAAFLAYGFLTVRARNRFETTPGSAAAVPWVGDAVPWPDVAGNGHGGNGSSDGGRTSETSRLRTSRD